MTPTGLVLLYDYSNNTYQHFVLQDGTIITVPLYMIKPVSFQIDEQ